MGTDYWQRQAVSRRGWRGWGTRTRWSCPVVNWTQHPGIALYPTCVRAHVTSKVLHTTAPILSRTPNFFLCVARYDEDWDVGSVKLPRSSRVDANIHAFTKHYP
jgi:hypothetical protein